jgi:putative CocE/NonD family hydrolase
MVETPLFFHSGGCANSLAGDGRLSFEAPAADEEPDSFTYNPDDATPSQPDPSEAINCGGPEDNRWRLRRDDVLVYTSAPLEEGIEMSGHPRVVLHAASDCPDTDWHVTLSDVQPDGRSDELVGGRLRASYRMGRDMEPSPLVPGEVHEFGIELMATSNVFKRGHRIRVTVASANYPRYARNPNTGSHYVDDEHWRIATNTLYHSPEHPSHLLAPIVPRANGD